MRIVVLDGKQYKVNRFGVVFKRNDSGTYELLIGDNFSLALIDRVYDAYAAAGHSFHDVLRWKTQH